MREALLERFDLAKSRTEEIDGLGETRIVRGSSESDVCLRELRR